MTFSLDAFVSSLASYLQPNFPGVAIYANPNQQGTKMPCFFVGLHFARVEHRIGGGQFKIYTGELSYLEAYNLPDLDDRYRAAVEKLDGLMELIPYSSGGEEEPQLLRTSGQEWQIELGSLRYSFELRIAEQRERQGPYVQNVDYREEVIS